MPNLGFSYFSRISTNIGITDPLLITSIIIIGILLWAYYDSNSADVTLVKASDDHEYVVLNLPDRVQAAEMLSKIRHSLVMIVADIVKTAPDDHRSKSLISRFHSDNISEGAYDTHYTSYSIGKGQKIVLCMRQRDSGELVPYNTMMFVALHELSHVMTDAIGHPPVFWENFRYILGHAIKLGLYNEVMYNRDPVAYCGLTITDTPL